MKSYKQLNEGILKALGSGAVFTGSAALTGAATGFGAIPGAVVGGLGYLAMHAKDDLAAKDDWDKLKSIFGKKTKTPEDVAKKHKLPVSDIMKSLKHGVRVEREHTTKNSIAQKIALDHLYELPNYYKRLKQVEESKKPWTKDRIERILNYLQQRK